MERFVFMSAGAVIAVGGLVYLIKLLLLRFTGLKINAEVVAVKEPKQGTYVHTLKFVFNGKVVQKDDRTGYSQPFKIGDIKKIVCCKNNSGKFEYADALNKNIVIFGVMVVMAVLIVVRFAFFVVE